MFDDTGSDHASQVPPGSKMARLLAAHDQEVRRCGAKTDDTSRATDSAEVTRRNGSENPSS